MHEEDLYKQSYRDYVYFKKAGWFESDYFYPTRLGPVKKGVARLVDTVVTRRARNKRFTNEENGAGS